MYETEVEKAPAPDTVYIRNVTDQETKPKLWKYHVVSEEIKLNCYNFMMIIMWKLWKFKMMYETEENKVPTPDAVYARIMTD